MPKNKTDNFLKAIKKYAGAQKKAMEGEVKQLKSERLKEAEEKAKSYIDYLIDGYSSYGPQEVPKLKKAVIKTYGDTLVVCVSDDGNMQKVLDGVFEK